MGGKWVGTVGGGSNLAFSGCMGGVGLHRATAVSGASVALTIKFLQGEAPEKGWKEIVARELLRETFHLHTFHLLVD